MLTTEDLFLYEQKPKFVTNNEALLRLFKAVANEPGVRHISLTYGTLAPVVKDPSIIEALTPIPVGMSRKQHPASTHPQRRYQSLFVGLETGSVRLFRKYMHGKSYPFRPEQWPEVVLRGMEILNRHNWFPFCTFILGLPGETESDTKQSLELLHALRDTKWCVTPTLLTPLEKTRLASRESAKLPQLTELQWEFFFTCWRYNLDFLRGTRKRMLFALGVPLYYYLLGRRLFGEVMKYRLLRLAHVPEWILRRRLYLDLSKRPIAGPGNSPEPFQRADGGQRNLSALDPDSVSQGQA